MKPCRASVYEKRDSRLCEAPCRKVLYRYCVWVTGLHRAGDLAAGKRCSRDARESFECVKTGAYLWGPTRGPKVRTGRRQDAITRSVSASIFEAVYRCLHKSISAQYRELGLSYLFFTCFCQGWGLERLGRFVRSEEHTSELQSHVNLVCRLLL